MQFSALLALLPLAYALPQATAPVEAGGITWDDCMINLSSCESSCGDKLWPSSIPHPCAIKCHQTFTECRANTNEKRSVEEAPVEARDVEAGGITWDDCMINLSSCESSCGDKLWPSSIPHPCAIKCHQTFTQCRASKNEKRSVEEAPVEARDVEAGGITWDDCMIDLSSCESSCGDKLWPSSIPHPCAIKCHQTFTQCRANKNEKRSFEDSLIQTRNNHAEEITDCYDDVADCKAHGGSIPDCYAPLNGCLWALFEKYGKRSE